MSILFFHGDQQLALFSGDVSSCVKYTHVSMAPIQIT